MEKSCHSSGGESTSSNSRSSNFHQQNNNNTTTNDSNSRDQYLKHLNKISHKISKDSRPPPIRKYPVDNLRQNPQQQHQQQSQQQQHQQSQQQPQQQQQQQHQPPVYNINKNDFRDVVQKLTGSPAHERSFSTPPPIHPPKPPSSRLQRIRPPPLAHLSPRPPLPLTTTNLPPTTTTTAGVLTNNAANINCTGNFVGNNNGRSVSPLSPLPPFPSVHATAESPISAYMRYLQSSIPTVDYDSKRFSSGFSPLVSPRWNNPNSFQPLVSPRWNNSINNPGPLQPPPPLPQPQQVLPSPTAAMSPSQFLIPSSPMSFGKLPSPRSPYPLLSPTFLFSPTAGQLGFPQFPPSPRFPVPSPRWRDL
ncbi:VQ motif-containing protein 9-like [Telopea speciosissima]|uniref:VQ motif-containing protein 9-like n=1 Tax=Telopea speciosissima TaxID=54955 RepID=UPI001CC635FD|nr:VQ motif-containing protein 9-like [Telopea speciosissima]